MTKNGGMARSGGDLEGDDPTAVIHSGGHREVGQNESQPSISELNRGGDRRLRSILERG